jgi:hypothetical protein
VVGQKVTNPAIIRGHGAAASPASMNIIFFKAFEACIPGLHSVAAIGEMATSAGTPISGLVLRLPEPQTGRRHGLIRTRWGAPDPAGREECTSRAARRRQLIAALHPKRCTSMRRR